MARCQRKREDGRQCEFDEGHEGLHFFLVLNCYSSVSINGVLMSKCVLPYDHIGDHEFESASE